MKEALENSQEELIIINRILPDDIDNDDLDLITVSIEGKTSELCFALTYQLILSTNIPQLRQMSL